MAETVLRPTLKILTGYGDPSAGGSSSAVLAMTPDAMLACEEHSVPYYTTEDFYSCRRFREENEMLRPAAEEFFLKLDNRVKGETHFAYSYTANIYWFQVLFDDLLYTTRLCEAIKARYDTILIIGKRTQDGDLKFEPVISAGRIVMKFAGIENKIRMLAKAFRGKVEWADSPACGGPSGTVNIPQVRHYFKKAGNKLLAMKAQFMSKVRPAENGTVFIVQDGYEIEFLKKAMRNFLFIDLSRELSVALNSQEVDAPSDLGLDAEIAAFAEKFFPAFGEELIRLFNLYYSRILSRMADLESAVRGLIEKYRPIAFIYPISSTTVYEELYASMACRYGIPLYYFEHGAFALMLCRDPYRRYREYNDRIKKIRIFCSDVQRLHEHSEARRLCGNAIADSQGIALGSMTLFDLAKKAPRKARSKKILYCPTFFSFALYKQLLYTVPDREVFDINNDIVETAGEQGLSLDIKTIPGQDAFQRPYFMRLVRWHGSNAHVIGGMPAEEIIGNYGLLILDYLATTMLPVGFIHRIPVILYVKDRSLFNEHSANDLESRCYIVNDKAGLSRLLRLFARGELDPKFSEEFIRKYAFPDLEKDPAHSIASYVINGRGIVSDAGGDAGCGKREPERVSDRYA